MTGQWVVVVRDIPANEDQLLGPFRSEERAAAVARRIGGDIAARHADRITEAFVKWVRPGQETEELRDELLADLDEMGYA